MDSFLKKSLFQRTASLSLFKIRGKIRTLKVLSGLEPSKKRHFVLCPVPQLSSWGLLSFKNRKSAFFSESFSRNHPEKKPASIRAFGRRIPPKMGQVVLVGGFVYNFESLENGAILILKAFLRPVRTRRGLFDSDRKLCPLFCSSRPELCPDALIF